MAMNPPAFEMNPIATSETKLEQRQSRGQNFELEDFDGSPGKYLCFDC